LNCSQIGYLQPLFQVHQSSILDKKCSMVIYKLCTNDMSDMITLTITIKEDIEFQKGIIVKLKPRKFPSLETEWISSIWTLEINTY
jgi:hypothetical protein